MRRPLLRLRLRSGASHGPHLYLKFNAEGKTYSVYVPPEQGEAIKGAHAAWLRFQEIGTEVSASNRERFLRDLKREKQAAEAEAGKGAEEGLVIERRRRQLNFADGLIAEEVGELWEDWMRQVDQVLTDRAAAQYRVRGVGAPLAEQPHARAQGHTRGSGAAPAAVEAHAQLELCDSRARGARQPGLSPVHARGRGTKCPTPRPWASSALALGPEIIEQIHQRVVAIAQEKKIIAGPSSCGWIRPWWRPTSTIRPTAACSATGYGCSRAR